MKKRWWILSGVLILILISILIFYFSFFYVYTPFLYFPEINGVVLDVDGKPLENQKVIAEYSCQSKYCWETCSYLELGFRETYTDKQGKFLFNNLDYPDDSGINNNKCSIGIESGCKYPSSGCEDKYTYGFTFYIKDEKETILIVKDYKSPFFKAYSESSDLPLYEKAIDEKDYTICEEIWDPYLKDKCLLRYSPLSINLCERISTISFKNSCFFKLAIALKDKSLCERISSRDVNIKKRCYTQYYIEIGNLSHCSTLIESDDSRCFSDIAIKQKNFSICNEIEPEHLRIGWCQYPIARAMGDIKYCSYIEKRVSFGGYIFDKKACEIYYT